jgi:hypothetical protein
LRGCLRYQISYIICNLFKNKILAKQVICNYIEETIKNQSDAYNYYKDFPELLGNSDTFSDQELLDIAIEILPFINKANHICQLARFMKRELMIDNLPIFFNDMVKDKFIPLI